ncbi:MAG: FKBP-type peptidyl-prolyl cis-trans isomerase [Woeseiaceae bacterium]|nr:FKBP-type peptidyl-prolyl cis-trans isomerase [Woeseiaceae bacterium]
MKHIQAGLCIALLFALAGCGQSDESSTEEAVTADPAPAPQAAAATEIVPGLMSRTLREGDGETATAGQTAIVHYTGWLYDPQAPDNRGEKFDSSVDRDQHFRFVVGAGQVIQGWDQGVAGMQVGEKRELTIAPELAYGERGAGTVIPAGATLVFEVELAGLNGESGKPASPQ